MLDARLHHAVDDAHRERGSRQAPSDAVPHTDTDALADAYAATNRNAAAYATTNPSTHTGANARTNTGTVSSGCDACCLNRGDPIGRRGDELAKRGAGSRG